MESNPYSSPSANLFGSNGSAVSPEVISQLQKTKPWVRLISIVMYIGGSLTVIIGIFMMIAGGAVVAKFAAVNSDASSVGLAAMPAGMGVVYIVMGIFYLYPARKLGSYASKIAALSASGAVADLEAALNQQCRFWKFVGILTLISVVFMLGALAFGVVAGIAQAGGRI